MNTDRSGMLVGFPLHDSQLVAFLYKDQDLELIFIKDGVNFNVKLKSIQASGFSEFKLDAILSEIFFWKLKDAPLDILDLVDNAWNVLFSGVTERGARISSAIKMQQKFPDFVLIQFNFSYGGSFSLVCDRINIENVLTPIEN